MQTNFTANQLADPAIAEADGILRACVHCGFCTATCPTYVLLGDENDSPRGRIYLIKEMLESDARVTRDTVKHIDRCLSCLSCMTTCPSGVHYMHLVDHARTHIQNRYARPVHDRVIRRILAMVLPNPARFRAAALFGRPFRWLKDVFNLFAPTRALGAMLELLPDGELAKASNERIVAYPSGGGEPTARVLLHPGCAQQVLRPEINQATIRLLNRLGVEVIVPEATRCCGALEHHLGRDKHPLAQARANIDLWVRELDRYKIDAIISNTSGCGTMIRDYGFLLRNDPGYAVKAERVSALTKDITLVIAELGLDHGLKPQPDAGTRQPPEPWRLRVAYHSACSLQHGQKVHDVPMALLAEAGFAVETVPEGHLCCGSAGTYNILQPELANALLDRKLERIALTGADIVAAGNIGCIGQLSRKSGTPVVHTVELLDWATGGPLPEPLVNFAEHRPGQTQAPATG